MTVFSVRHRTIYRYARPVRFDEHRLLFRPRDSFDQRLLSATLDATPGSARPRWIHDVFGNCVTLVDFTDAGTELRFDTVIRLEHSPQAGPEFRLRDHARFYPFAYDEEEAPDLAALVRPQFPNEAEAVGAWAQQFLRKGRRTETGTLLMTLCRAVRESFAYARRTTPGTQTPATTLRLRRGTCRDFALLMMEAVRALGLAARFVTGYIYVPSRDGAAGLAGTLGGGSTHAWCQVYLPGAGWVEFDPTNGIVGNRDLIRVAVTRDPEQAVPLSGSYRGRAADFLDMAVQVNVTAEQQAAEPPHRESVLVPTQEAAMMGSRRQQG